MQINKFILTVSCSDQLGIIAKIASFIATHQGNILELAQFVDAPLHKFFMRCVFECSSPLIDKNHFKTAFTPLANTLNLDWNLYSSEEKPRALILVSKEAHCLNDLLHRVEHANFPIHPVGVISNHDKLKGMADWHRVPFFHFPVSAQTKEEQEERIAQFVEDQQIDLVILARYMQILSPKLTRRIFGKAINIHHSFLPSFKGAKPYHQAFERGVKLIGATAHFVSDELDEGPIIDQEVIRVGHAYSPEELVMLGRDAECLVLSRAIKQVAEKRVFLNEKKTVVLN